MFMPSCFSHVQLFATLWTVAHQAPLSMEILQARILEWLAISFSREFSRPKDQTHVSYISCWQAGSLSLVTLKHFYILHKVKVAQSYLTLCDSFQARILEWVAYPFSGRSSQPRNRTEVSCIAGGFFTN